MINKFFPPVEKETKHPEPVLQTMVQWVPVGTECQKDLENSKKNDLMGKIVLVRDDNLARNVWLIGRIVDILPSKDSLVRNVMVKTPTSLLRRAVQRLSSFENY